MDRERMDEVLAGQAERLNPADEDSAMICWRPISQWQRLGSVQPPAEVNQMLDPNLLVNWWNPKPSMIFKSC